jgi:hypothetical protein
MHEVYATHSSMGRESSFAEAHAQDYRRARRAPVDQFTLPVSDVGGLRAKSRGGAQRKRASALPLLLRFCGYYGFSLYFSLFGIGSDLCRVTG